MSTPQAPERVDVLAREAKERRAADKAAKAQADALQAPLL